MSDTQIPLQPDYYYHIYNHAVGNTNLFENDKDYFYFLSSLKKYILPVTDLIVYCLMPNHFHLVVRFKNPEEIKLDDWKYSSYKVLICSKPSLIDKEEIINLFGDVENLIYCHSNHFELESY